MSEVTRKIYFYQVSWVDVNREIQHQDANFLNDVLHRIENIPIQSTSTGTYFVLREYNDYYRDNINAKFWRLERIRENDLPLGFDIKEIREFPLSLSENQGISEPTHFVVFPNGIIGSEYNYYGAKQINSKLMWLINTQLSSFLEQNGLKFVKITPILKKDVYDLIDKFVEIRGIKISIATNYAKLLKREDPESFNALFSATELVDDMYLTLSFSIGKGRKRGDITKFGNIIKSLKKLLSRSENDKNLRVVEIRGRFEEGGDITDINVLEELMIAEKRVPKLDERSRAVNPISMYQEIISAYESLKEDLKEYVWRENR